MAFNETKLYENLEKLVLTTQLGSGKAMQCNAMQDYCRLFLTSCNYLMSQKQL